MPNYSAMSSDFVLGLNCKKTLYKYHKHAERVNINYVVACHLQGSKQ